MAKYLDLADYLLIAEAVVGVSADSIARWPGIGLAESALHAPAASFEGTELYDETVATIEGVAAGTISERVLAEWLRATAS